MFLKDIMTSLTHIIDDDEDDHQNDERKFLEDFLKYRKRHSRKKRTNAPVKEAQKLIQDIQNGEKSPAAGKKIKKRPLIGGAIGLESTSTPNAPPKKKKKTGNPLKKELSNPQGLDFANQAGALMAQTQKVEMMLPKDMTKEAARPEKNNVWREERKHKSTENKSKCI